jgi:hypothetical protein
MKVDFLYLYNNSKLSSFLYYASNDILINQKNVIILVWLLLSKHVLSIIKVKVHFYPSFIENVLSSFTHVYFEGVRELRCVVYSILHILYTIHNCNMYSAY